MMSSGRNKSVDKLKKSIRHLPSDEGPAAIRVKRRHSPNSKFDTDRPAAVKKYKAEKDKMLSLVNNIQEKMFLLHEDIETGHLGYAEPYVDTNAEKRKNKVMNLLTSINKSLDKLPPSNVPFEEKFFYGYTSPLSLLHSVYDELQTFFKSGSIQVSKELKWKFQGWRERGLFPGNDLETLFKVLSFLKKNLKHEEIVLEGEYEIGEYILGRSREYSSKNTISLETISIGKSFKGMSFVKTDRKALIDSFICLFFLDKLCLTPKKISEHIGLYSHTNNEGESELIQWDKKPTRSKKNLPTNPQD